MKSLIWWTILRKKVGYENPTSGAGRIPSSNNYRVTVSGHVRIAEAETNVDSSQAFVAMWFDDSMERVYDEGIAPAIKDCGFKPKRIDRDPAVDKIDDAIISQIKKSRFLVADFTHGKKGARGRCVLRSRLRARD